MLLTLTRPLGARALGLSALLVGLEWSRAVAARGGGVGALLALAGGGLLLCATGAVFTPARLGMGIDRLPLRLLGGAALAAVLLLPAAVRWQGAPALAGGYALAAMLVSAGEEVAFRGALYAVLEEWGGAGLAVIGSSLAFAAGHLLSHPPEFLPAVLGAGLLLGLWRWACRDLVGPIVAHSIADLAL